MWHHSDKGNTSNGVSNVWDRLCKRVKKDYEDFPNYSFNKLRKTSATRILQIASAEVASMVLAHKTINDDELLENYALIPWESSLPPKSSTGVRSTRLFLPEPATLGTR